MTFLSVPEICALITRIMDHCFPGYDFGLASRFASYLTLDRPQVLQIFLRNRLAVDALIAQFLSGPLQKEDLDGILRLPLDLQVCILDRLLFAYFWMTRIRQHNAQENRTGMRYRLPDLLVRLCVDRYARDEVRRWLAKNGLPSLFELASDLMKPLQP